MYTKKQLLEQAETFYVYDFVNVNQLAKKLNLNRKTIMAWRDEYDWNKKRQSYLNSRQSFHEELYEFARKLMRDITARMDANEDFLDSGKMSTFCRILPMLYKVKSYEDIVFPKTEGEKPRGLSPDIIAQIEEDILGIHPNDQQE